MLFQFLTQEFAKVLQKIACDEAAHMIVRNGQYIKGEVLSARPQ